MNRIAVFTIFVQICANVHLGEAGSCPQVSEFKYPDDGKEYLFYGFKIDNSESEGASTGPVIATVNGKVCAKTSGRTSGTKNFNCAKVLGPAKNLVLKGANGGSFTICYLGVSAIPYCGRNSAYNWTTHKCEKCPHGVRDGKCKDAPPKPTKPACSTANHHYCHRTGDCHGRDIRHIGSYNLNQCQAACSKDCNCKSIQHRGRSCWLKHHACTDNQLVRKTAAFHDYVKKDGTAKIAKHHYCHRTGDCHGRDIRHIGSYNLNQCQAACSNECNCKSIQHRGRSCWLKHHVCTDNQLVRKSAAYHDYVRKDGNPQKYKYCHRRGDCNGRDIRHIGNYNLNQCQSACSNECNCKSIQHRGRSCWLKHHACTDRQLVRKTAAFHDYVRKGVNERC